MTQPEDLLSIVTSHDGLAASGEIDAHTAPVLAAALEAAGTSARLDLSAIDFVDSSGLRVLVDAHQRSQAAGGALTIVAPSPSVVRLFEISGVQDYLDIDPA